MTGKTTSLSQKRRSFCLKMNSKGVKINHLLECPVCMETISSAPIFQCRNGHIVCKDCHPKLETCPICRDANLYDTPMAIRNLKLEEIVKRSYRNWGTTSDNTYTNLSRLAAIEGVRAIATFYFFIAILKWPFQRNMFQKSAKN